MRVTRAAWLRIAPFAVFIALLAVRGAAPEDGAWGFDARWLYGVAVLVVGGLLFAFRREYGELSAQHWLNRRDLALSVAVGLLVFVLWIALDAPWMQIGEATAAFVPVDAEGRLHWPLVALRWIGAALLVPLIEELFWRSFLMRWIEQARFETALPQRIGMRAVVLSTFVFTLAHTLWLAAAVAGLAYAWLYVRTGSLWAPVVAHATTNGVLGVWVIATRQWQFW